MSVIYQGRRLLVVDESQDVRSHELFLPYENWDALERDPKKITGSDEFGRYIDIGHLERTKVVILVPDPNSDIAAITIFKGGFSDEKTPHISIKVLPKDWEAFHDKVERFGIFGDRYGSSSEFGDSPQKRFVEEYLGRMGVEPSVSKFSGKLVYPGCQTSLTISPNPLLSQKNRITLEQSTRILKTEKILSPHQNLNDFLVGIIKQAAKGETLDLIEIDKTLELYASALNRGGSERSGGQSYNSP